MLARGAFGEVALGLVIVGVAIGMAYACSGPLQLTPLMQCRLDSLDVLPDDPNMATVYDAVDIIERLAKCERAVVDGGVP